MQRGECRTEKKSKSIWVLHTLNSLETVRVLRFHLSFSHFSLPHPSPRPVFSRPPRCKLTSSEEKFLAYYRVVVGVFRKRSKQLGVVCTQGLAHVHSSQKQLLLAKIMSPPKLGSQGT